MASSSASVKHLVRNILASSFLPSTWPPQCTFELQTTLYHAYTDARRVGWLTKEGAIVKNWKRRYFVLKESTLSYYENPEAERPKGVISLSGSEVCDVEYKGKPCIQLTTPSRTYYMFAETTSDKQEWLQAIRTSHGSKNSGPSVPLKILVLGPSCCGKSALIARGCKNVFLADYDETSSVMSSQKEIPTSSGRFTFKLWEIPGRELVDELHDDVREGVDAIMICFDLTNFSSFGRAKKMFRSVRFLFPSAVDLLVGCKSDLSDHRQIGKDIISAFVDENKTTYFETSASSNERIAQIFQHVAEVAGKHYTNVVF